jgi:hypothetical protein
VRRRALSPQQQAWLEDQLGPVGQVNLWDGPLVDLACRLMGAGALTLRSSIWCSASASAAVARWDPWARALLVHEAVHVLQYRRQGTVRFLFDYCCGYLAGRLRGLGHDAAYRALPAEREAFAAEAAVSSRAEG